MNALLRCLLASAGDVPDASAGSMGKWVFVAALGLLLVWLILMPKQLIGQAKGAPPWWRNVRFWAIVVAAVQLGVYAYFG